jgi:hypothetical protein
MDIQNKWLYKKIGPQFWCTVPLSYKIQNVIKNTFIDYFSPLSNFRYVCKFFILILKCLKYLFVYQNAAPAKPWGLIITTKLTRIVTEHLSTSARMDAFTKGKHSYLWGTLGPIVLLHYIKDFWTAKKLHTCLNIVSKNGGGGVLYIRQCFCFSTAHLATEHQKVNIFVVETTRTQRTEKPTMLICCSCGSNSREEVSMEWTGDRSSRWPAARKACSSRRLSEGRWQEWSCSFNGVDEENGGFRGLSAGKAC